MGRGKGKITTDVCCTNHLVPSGEDLKWSDFSMVGHNYSSEPSEELPPLWRSKDSTNADRASTRIWGDVGSWGRIATIMSNLYLLQLRVLATAGDGDCCDGLMQPDQSVSLHLKANDRSDNYMPFISGQN